MTPTTQDLPVRRANGEGGTSLARIPDSGPSELYRHATDVAGVCGSIVKQTAKNIQGRKFVCVEGWQAITTAHGCALSIDSVSEDGGGNVTAIASVRRMSDGATLATSEGFVGMDEPRWAKCPRYARRAMAQTRAMSRVARSVFAHVVILIDKGLATTPAEEVDDAAPSQFRGRRSNEPPPNVDTSTGEELPDLSNDGEFLFVWDAVVEGKGLTRDDGRSLLGGIVRKRKWDWFNTTAAQRQELIDELKAKPAAELAKFRQAAQVKQPNPRSGVHFG